MSLDPQDFSGHVPGALGSLGAALVMVARGKWRLGAALLLPGIAGAWYAAPVVSAALSAPSELTGFLIGIFGMFFFVKIIDELDRFEATRLLHLWLAKVLGLSPEPVQKDEQ